jgi:predicted transposase YdaD
MGIIETVKMLAEEEAREKGLKEGKVLGKEEKTVQIIRNLFTLNKFSIAEIAQIAEVSEEFVLKMKGEL